MTLKEIASEMTKIRNLTTIIEKKKEEFVEVGADLEHERWLSWQRHCHNVLRENCPSPELEKVLIRWDRQIATPYSELSEEEKESDRREVRTYYPLLEKAIRESVEEALREEKERKDAILDCIVEDIQSRIPLDVTPQEIITIVRGFKEFMK